MATALSGTVRISSSSREALRDLAEREAVSMQTVLERAIEDYRRKCFLDAVNKAFVNLQNRNTDWATEQQERNDWSGTTADGIEDQ